MFHVDCLAYSGAAETYGADERKWKCLCCTGRQSQLPKCRGVTIGNVQNKHVEDGPSSDGWNFGKRQVVSHAFSNADPVVMIGKPFQSVSQMEHRQPNVFFQHDGASLHTGPHSESL